jgi:hypothetical protein
VFPAIVLLFIASLIVAKSSPDAAEIERKARKAAIRK